MNDYSLNQEIKNMTKFFSCLRFKMIMLVVMMVLVSCCSSSGYSYNYPNSRVPYHPRPQPIMPVMPPTPYYGSQQRVMPPVVVGQYPSAQQPQPSIVIGSKLPKLEISFENRTVQEEKPLMDEQQLTIQDEFPEEKHKKKSKKIKSQIIDNTSSARVEVLPVKITLDLDVVAETILSALNSMQNFLPNEISQEVKEMQSLLKDILNKTTTTEPVFEEFDDSLITRLVDSITVKETGSNTGL